MDKQKGKTRKTTYLPVAYVEGISPQANISSGTGNYKWEHFFEEIKKSAENEEVPSFKVVPVDAFYNPPLGNFLKVMRPGLKIEARIHDYEQMFADKSIYWIATVNKIVGYRLLLRFEGMDSEGDEKFDFWINIGSDDIKHVGYCATNENCELLPPDSIRKRQSDWSKYILCKLHACKTLTSNWENERIVSLVESRFKVGNRLEMLDRLYSTRVRPARVIQQLGRRICVKVSKEDVDKDDFPNEDAQCKAGIWIDESYELIFPVGWAVTNNYGLAANKKYKDHCNAIKAAIDQGIPPSYDLMDASPEIFNEWKENASENTYHWEKGMKFECLDPLNESFLELKVATCIELLKDGYLKIGFDGPEMEEEAIPVHCTSPYLFPINYASEYGIALKGPSETMEDFSWKSYLRQSQAVAATENLFDPVPPPEKLQKFEIGAKIEATDQCESNLICPSTIVAVRGRLLQIHFDGWESNYDQLFDYRSRDIFPVGWCEIYGYKLEPPKTMVEPSKKKKKVT